ncbi:MAG: MBL fold metallo-hydrolase [Rubrobacteraceae bacterium]|nr:MBL fold metallo-hydrolase [Rubrobacteraceae bacterium]MCL6437172.1 MBL fold metallo-hydrolase [Rubrobacteraceae bacterium]
MSESGERGLIPRLEAVEVPPGMLVILGLGQAGVGIRGPEGVIYVDPYLTDYGGEGERLDRCFEPPVDPAAIDDASCVLVSHEHVDHFDPETLGSIASSSPGARFYAPYACDFSKAGIDPERVTVPAVDEPFEVAGARITAVPSAHTGLERTDRGYRYLGYVIECNGVTVYHAGDTVVYDGMIETLSRWRLDAMFLPINGRDYFRTAREIVGNTDFREAVELAETLDVGMVFPTHYDLVAGNTENPAYFVDYINRRNLHRPYHLLRPGELFALLGRG